MAALPGHRGGSLLHPVEITLETIHARCRRRGGGRRRGASPGAAPGVPYLATQGFEVGGVLRGHGHALLGIGGIVAKAASGQASVVVVEGWAETRPARNWQKKSGPEARFFDLDRSACRQPRPLTPALSPAGRGSKGFS